MLLVVAIVALIALDPPLVIWLLSVVYALSGPLQHLRQSDTPRSQEGETNYEKDDLH
jgi:CDP-diacylglycerol--serine O-phosphatidyltransferase